MGMTHLKIPDFHDIRHMKLVRLSASRTGRLYPQEILAYKLTIKKQTTATRNLPIL